MSAQPKTAATGVIDFVGWEKKDGREQFIVRVAFEGPPPAIPLRAVWDRSPVHVVLAGVTDGE